MLACIFLFFLVNFENYFQCFLFLFLNTYTYSVFLTSYEGVYLHTKGFGTDSFAS